MNVGGTKRNKPVKPWPLSVDCLYSVANRRVVDRTGKVAASIHTHAGRALDPYSEYCLLQLVCEKHMIYL